MKIKSVRFSMGVRCGKGSIEELFIDTSVEKYRHYSLELNEDQTVDVTNHTEKKTITVYPTNIAYLEKGVYLTNEPSTKRTSKTITQ